MQKMLLFLLLLPVIASGSDVSLAVCRYPDGVYQFSYIGQVDDWSFEGAESYDLNALTASGYGVKFTIYYGGTSQSVYGYPDVPTCPTEDVWKPSAPSILIPAPDGLFLLEIQDAYGHWSRVTDAAHPDGIILQTSGGFIELIGSVGQDIDPAHYRLIEVNNE